MNIFGSHGRINADIDPASIPEDRRAAFVALAAAQNKCDQAEASMKAANDKVAEAVIDLDRAHAALPKSSFLDEWRRSVGRYGKASSPSPAPHLAPHDALRNAVDNLDVARWCARECREAVAAARAAFSAALTAWNRTMLIQSVEEAKLDVIRTNQMERVKRAAQGRLTRPATISETARAMRGGNAQRGGGNSFRRGAFTKAAALETEANRRRAATIAATNAAHARVKLPSQR